MKKSLHKILCLTLAFLMICSMSACKSNKDKNDNPNWWEDSGTTFVCKDGDIEKTIEVQVDENRDGTYHISFMFCVYGGSSCILDSISDEVTISEEDESSLFSYTGTDIYSDKINIIYSSKDKTLTVTSISELSGGTSNYDLPCSGTYKQK